MTSHSVPSLRLNGSSRDVRSRLRSALELLHRAHRYALDLECDVWELAVEYREFSARGLASCDLRWLAARGYIAHGVETTRSSDERRTFRFTGADALSEESCFVLTPDAYRGM